jgi:hypothetical protein
MAILFCALQAYCYNSATHPALHSCVWWGLLPSRDGQLYLNNAVEIAEGIGIRIGFGARQLWPGFLALLHTWCNGDLKLMLGLLALMQAAITFAGWEMVCKLLGRAAAFVWLCCVVFFYRTHVVGVFMTEQLGLPLGILAAVLLLYGWRTRSHLPWLFGLLFLTFALSARPGCYFVLVFLLAGTFWRFRQAVPYVGVWHKLTGNLAWRKGIVSTCLVGLCLASNSLSYLHLVNPPRIPSNFWMVLYGIAKGGTWVNSLEVRGGELYDKRRINTMSDAPYLYDFMSRVKQEAIKEIVAKPATLLHGTWRAWQDVILKQTFFYEGSARWWGLALLLMSAATLLLGLLKHKAGFENGGFYWLVWLGILLSLPLVPPWDSGGRAYAATNPLVWLTPAAFCSWCINRIFVKRPKKGQVDSPNILNGSEGIEASGCFRINAIAGALLVISSVLLPSMLLELNRNKKMPRYSDLISLETSSARVHEIPATLITPNRGIIVGSTNSRTFLPWVAREDFERGVMRGWEFSIGEFVKDLPDGSYIALLGRPRYLFCDPSVLGDGLGISNILLMDNDWMAYKYVMSLSKGMALTPKQVMILCPPYGHEIFWKPAVPALGK